MHIYSFVCCVLLMFIVLKSGRCEFDECVRFDTNSDTLTVQEHSTVSLNVSIQQICYPEQIDIGSVSVFVLRSTPPHLQICSLIYKEGGCIDGSTASCRCQQRGFSVTRTIQDPVKEVWMIRGFIGYGTDKAAEKAVDILVGGPSAVTRSRSDAETDAVTRAWSTATTTTRKTLIDDHSKHGSTPSPGASEEAEDEDEEEIPGPKDDNPSFTQTPAFAGFVIVGVVMAIILILLFVILFRQKGIPALARRRARNSLVIPDNYEHPARGSHHYERPIFRGRQQQPPPPPSDPVDVNRDSLAGHYSVIDDAMVLNAQYQVPVTTGGRRPTHGDSNV